MKLYFNTQEETITVANEAKENNPGTYTEKSSVQCDCGESFAVFLRDEKTLGIATEFIFCESCNLEN